MRKKQNIIKTSISFLEERKINRSNKVLMTEKVLSYSQTLDNGIKKYKTQNHRFAAFMLLSIILIDLPIISLPCCLVSVVFLIKMLQLIKYRSVSSIIDKIGRDIAYRGIYNKGTIEEMVKEFKFKYGEDIIEYYELMYMIKNYEVFISKIEEVIKGIHEKRYNVNTKETIEENKSFNRSCAQIQDIDSLKKAHKKIYSKTPLICRSEEGEIKKVNRAIEFLEDKNKCADAVVLRGRNNNLTVYLYKKRNELQNNAL